MISCYESKRTCGRIGIIIIRVWIVFWFCCSCVLNNFFVKIMFTFRICLLAYFKSFSMSFSEDLWFYFDYEHSSILFNAFFDLIDRCLQCFHTFLAIETRRGNSIKWWRNQIDLFEIEKWTKPALPTWNLLP